MHDFAAIVRQLRCLLRADDGDKPCSGHLARVRGEYPVDLLPYLQLGRLETDRKQRSQQVGVTAADLAQKRAWHRSEEA